MRAIRIAAVLSTLILLSSTSSPAQDTWDGPPPAHLSVVDGMASVGRDVNREDAIPGLPIVPGDVVRTDRGRVEIVFPDASVIDLDEFSTFELLSPSLYRLSEGRLRLAVPEGSSAGTSRLTLETPQAGVDIAGPGQYRLAMDGTPAGLQTVVDVLRGNATLYNERGSTVLRTGEQSVVSQAAPPTYARSFNTRQFDALDEWAGSLSNDGRGNGLSAQYLPSDLRSYSGVLDQNGAWAYEAPYGYVWYPTVGADWRPYGDGYWASMPAFGWTWIGASRWSWPTHHYGRWGYQRSRWYWIPDRRWAPAWVSWGSAPGYVSWAPLGWNNRPVFGLSVSTGYGGGWGTGWTVINRNYFGGPRWNVRQYSVRNAPSRAPFALQASAPPPVQGYVGRWSAGSANVGGASSSSRYGRPRSAAPSGLPRTGRDDRSGDGAVRTAPPTSGARSGWERGSQPNGRSDGARAVPRGTPGAENAAPPATYAAPPAASRGDGASRSGRMRPEAQGRPVESAADSQPSAPPPSGGAARPRYRDGGAVQSAPSPRSGGARAGDGGGRESRGGSSGTVGRAVPRSERSGNGGQSTGQGVSSGGGGGRAQGRRR